MEWSEPSLVEYEFTFGAKQRAGVVRLGFPRLREGDSEWSCACQIRGLKDGKIRLIRGVDGLQALIIALSVIRKALDRLKPIGQNGEAHEFIFPRMVSSAYGLEAHHDLCKIVDAEIKRNERRIARTLRARKKKK